MIISRFIIALSLVFLFSLSHSLQGNDPEHPMNQVTKTPVEGIVNYSRTGDLTGFGGATDPSAMPFLQQEGYSAVVNLRLADENGVDIVAGRKAAEAAGLEYIHLPFDSKNPPAGYFEQFLAVVENERERPVYIHCGSATRAAALWMSKRVIEDRWEIDAAEIEARAIAGKPDHAVAFAIKYIEAQKGAVPMEE